VKSLLKWIKWALVFIVAFPVFAFCLWYAFSFLTHLNELKDFSERGSKTVAGVKCSFYSLAVAGETKEGIRSYAIRQAYWSLVFDKNPSGTLSWHANNFLWYISSFLHLQEKQVFGLWVDCAYYGCGRGLKEVAHEYFGKELHEFSKRELAGLVVLVRSPTRYPPGSERAEQRVNEIMARTRTQCVQPDLVEAELLIGR